MPNSAERCWIMRQAHGVAGQFPGAADGQTEEGVLSSPTMPAVRIYSLHLRCHKAKLGALIERVVPFRLFGCRRATADTPAAIFGARAEPPEPLAYGR
jgi:hypothetical protein